MRGFLSDRKGRLDLAEMIGRPARYKAEAAHRATLEAERILRESEPQQGSHAHASLEEVRILSGLGGMALDRLLSMRASLRAFVSGISEYIVRPADPHPEFLGNVNGAKRLHIVPASHERTHMGLCGVVTDAPVTDRKGPVCPKCKRLKREEELDG